MAKICLSGKLEIKFKFRYKYSHFEVFEADARLKRNIKNIQVDPTLYHRVKD